MLDRESSRIYKNGKEIDLTGREFLLLSYLMENADKIISKERICEQVWGGYSSICDNTIMVHIRHIREKIEDTPSTPKQLITIKGLGYKLKKRTDQMKRSGYRTTFHIYSIFFLSLSGTFLVVCCLFCHAHHRARPQRQKCSQRLG